VENKISVELLNVKYGNCHVLKNISIKFRQNSITALIGASGCGKSTLLKSLNRLTDLEKNCSVSGKILLDGKDIHRNIEVDILRKRVGMVFQKPNPFDMSIYDNIAFGPKTHGVRSKAILDETVEKALKRAALWNEVKDSLKKNAIKLSGGQQQRLCIARALAINPEVLLMDEATSALDPSTVSQIEDIVLELKQRCTVIMVTHSLGQAIRISDKTAFLAGGRLIEQAETASFFTNPQNPQTKIFIKSGSI